MTDDHPTDSAAATGMAAAPRDATIDVLHGVAVADPFRPLENVDDPATSAWVAAEDGAARAAIAALPGRAAMRAWLTRVWDYPKLGVPERHGRRWFHWFNDGLSPQWSYAVQDSLDGARRTLIDPNALSADGTVALSGAFPTRDGRLVAYLLSEAGSDRQILRVRDVASGADLADELRWCKHSAVAWLADGSGFHYTRVASPDDDPAWDRRSQRVYFHRLGAPQAADRPVYAEPAEKNLFIWIWASADDRLLCLTTRRGTDEKNGLLVAPLESGAPVRMLFAVGQAMLVPTANLGTRWFAVTDLDAPNRRLVGFDEERPEPAAWRTLVAESDGVIDSAALLDQRLALVRQHHVSHRLSFHDLDGRETATVGFDEQVSLALGRPRPEDRELLFGVVSYRSPFVLRRADAMSGHHAVLRQSAAREDLSDCVARQVFVAAKDGARIPMTLIHRRDLVFSGDTPTRLTGYGGFNIALLPSFGFGIALWVRLGGVFAVASIRGGGEYGRAWHDAARGAAKETSFDDFIACAEWLVAEKITRPARLAISGGSNGGLLVSACMERRPDLFGAVVCSVPVTDMLRFHKFTFGAFWVSDYGDPDKAGDFAVLRRYSPLHNVGRGAKYPPLLVTTADHDDRVVPSHAYKLVATLRAEADPANRILLRVDRRAGHGMGKPTDMVIAELVDTTAFLCDALGLKVAEDRLRTKLS
ncbi:MAG: S9 family peptidase [Alphaproteobacteria bacterium]|nr:S9 family peptidase [Alphaproteobacteria bacterium]